MSYQQCNCVTTCGDCRKRGEVCAWIEAPSEPSGFTTAVLDVLTERQRQIHEEGWTPEHDDQHYGEGELSDAAVAYALHPYCSSKSTAPAPWPWIDEWWKPSTPRRDLIKAAALLIAEIERLDRAAAKEQSA